MPIETFIWGFSHHLLLSRCPSRSDEQLSFGCHEALFSMSNSILVWFAGPKAETQVKNRWPPINSIQH